MKNEFKLSEVGMIPIDWKSKTLGSMTTKIGDGLHGTPIYSHNGKYPFINGNNLIMGRVSITNDTKMVNHFEFLKHQKPLSEKSILMSINGTIGNLAVYEGEQIVLGKSVAYLILKPEIHYKFLYYVLQTQNVRNIFFDGLTGSTISNLGLTTIRNTNIPIPHIEEQKNIANVLTDIDSLLNGLELLISKKSNLKKAIIQKLFTGKMRLDGFKDKWEKKQLGEIANIFKGKALSKSSVSSSGLYQCILYGELFTVYDRVINKVVNRTDSIQGYPSVAGDVLLPGSTTTVGEDLATASALMLDNVMLGGDIVIIRCDKKICNPIFLANLITYVLKGDVYELTQGTTIHHLYGKDLKTLFLALPSLSEQITITNIISDIDLELNKLKIRQKKIYDLKVAIIQELLTGKTRLMKSEKMNA